MYFRYTPKEDKQILMYMRNKHLDKRDTKYIELAKLLKRPKRSILKRYRYLKKIENNSEIKRRYFIIFLLKYYIYNSLFFT